VIYSEGFSIGFWDLEARCPSANQASITCDLISELACSSGGTVIMVESGGSLFQLSPDHKQLKQLNSYEQRIIHYETAIPVFSSDGTIIAACSYRMILLWDATTGTLLRTIDTRIAEVHRLAFHPGGKLLASAGNTKRIQLWDAATGAEVNRYDWGIGPEIRCLAFSPDGMTAAAGGSSGKFVIWDVE
jgi:WD40 repeat protein